MRRLLAALLAVVLVCSMSIPAFAAEEEKEGNTDISIACFSFLSTHFQQDSDDIYKADNLIIRKPEQESTSEVILGKRKTPALFLRRCLEAVL